MTAICTIISSDYQHFATALAKSLQVYWPGSKCKVLIVDDQYPVKEDSWDAISLRELMGAPFAKDIEKKYSHTQKDRFRWALKPVLMGYLLEQGYEKVIFCDPDIYFVGTASFIEKLLEVHSIILTPHWPDLNFTQNPDSVFSVLRNGLFNAGFIGASKFGQPSILLWASMCHFIMDRQPELGVYDDQRFLDIIQVEFENVHIIRHRGCNLASWNIHSSPRAMINGQVIICEKYEPIFIHFTKETIINILNRNDIHLKKYLGFYEQTLLECGYNLNKHIDNIDKKEFSSAFYLLKHKLRLRTRIKKLFFWLAERL